MAQTPEPPNPLIDDPTLYAAAADDYVASASDDEDAEDGDDESGEGGDGGKGLKSSRNYDVVLQSLLDFANDDSLSEEENDKAKLEKLGIAPMSVLATGASAFASENDLSRKVFMARVGLFNLEIKPRDIANPQLIKLLDEKQAGRRRIFGIQTLDEIVTGAIGAAGMMIGAITSSVADYVKDKREERRIDRQIKNYESGQEEYGLDSEDLVEAKQSLQQVDFPVQEAEQDDPVLNYLREVQDRHDAFKNDQDSSQLMRTFNTLATLIAPEYVTVIKINTDVIGIGQEIQDIYKDFNPVG